MPGLLHTYLDDAAVRFPQREVLRFEGVAVSYAELASRSNQAAHALIEGGVQKRDRVGIYLHKGPEAIVGVYATLKAGAVFVPLDPLGPVSRIRAVIDDCGIKHLVTSERMRRRIDEMLKEGARLEWCLGNRSTDIGAHPGVEWRSWEDTSAYPAGSAPDSSINSDDVAYIFYTSGTTGEPKGMVHTHRSGSAFADWAAAEFGLTPTDRVTSHAPLHFDLMIFDYISTAKAGGCTVIVSEARAKMPASVLDLLETERVTVTFLVPSALVQMLTRGGIEGRALNSLREIIFGGEVMPIKYLKDWMQIVPGADFTNVYGVTECNVCTYYRVPSDEEEIPEDLPLGEAVPGLETAVVDYSGGRVVDPGEPGELLVAGDTVMRGYWNREEATSNVFVEMDAGGSRKHLRTGDVVRQLPSGQFLFSGRIDRQIKMRGNRVQLQDVEEALLRYDSVVEAVAVPLPDEEGSTSIGAAIVTRSTVDRSEFSRYIRGKLPWYAVPARVWVTPSIPRTSAGKIDMRAVEQGLREETLRSTDIVLP